MDYEPILTMLDESQDKTLILPDFEGSKLNNVNLSSLLQKVDSSIFVGIPDSEYFNKYDRILLKNFGN